jgi:arylsulfatase A-like enzyme
VRTKALSTVLLFGSLTMLASAETNSANRSTGAAERKPNLIVILTDDQGYHDVGFNGCKDIPTPNLDSIASNGVRFSNGYVTFSVCSPSRAGLLTGRYQQRFGHERNPRFQPDNRLSGLPLTETTLADALGKVGYRSGIIGKWHLGAHPDLHPLKRGFNEFFGFLGGGLRYLPKELDLNEVAQAKDNEGNSYRLQVQRDYTPFKTTQYLTDELSDEAVRFVEKHKGEPFFLYVAYNAPHTPMQATEKYLSRFNDIKNPERRTYAAMVSAVDDGVGRLLAKLREVGIEEDTLVFFLSDNGGPTDANASDNSPLRGKKSDVWEGGWRVPFAAQWPGHLPKGKVYDQPVISLDIFATIAALANAAVDPRRPLDGVNLMPFLLGEKSGAPHDAIYLRMYDKGAFAVRSGEFKLVIPQSGSEPQLFNLASDVGESSNVAGLHPEQLQELEKRRVTWNAGLIPPVFEGLLKAKQKPKADSLPAEVVP